MLHYLCPLRTQKNTYEIRKAYEDYFLPLGVKLFYISKPLQNIQEYSFFDGLLLPGGDDINPLYYHQNGKSKNNIIIKENDELDFKLIEAFDTLNKKIIGICRGLQIINVYQKGSLKQDILNHKNCKHYINYLDNKVEVNSYHHQSIDEIGKELKIIARALDGEIEIIKGKKKLGLQFHPELLINYEKQLFDKLILDFLNRD